MVYLYIFLLIILIIIFMPIKVRIIRNDYKNDVDLFFVKLFNVRLDLDKLIRYFLTTKLDRTRVTLGSILYNINMYKKSKNIINSFNKWIDIKKITIILKTNESLNDFDIYTNVLFYTGISKLQDYLKSNFKSIENQYYVVNNESENNELEFEMILNIRIAFFIYAIIRNIKDIPNIIKATKENKYGATSDY